MEKYEKAKSEFNKKLNEAKKETYQTIYGNDLREIILYDKLLELQEQLAALNEKMQFIKPEARNASLFSSPVELEKCGMAG